MAILDELVTQIENPDLRARIAAEVEKLAKQKKFGLVFEEHLPECTPLWDIPVKKGGKVALKTGQVSDFYTVLKIEDGIATCLNKDKSATVQFKVDELVSVAEFGEPIYPYHKPIDKVRNAPDSDLWHTLIEADNYTEQKKLAASVSRVAGNINQICRRINQTGHFYEDDIVELKAKQCEIWELLKQSQRAEL